MRHQSLLVERKEHSDRYVQLYDDVLILERSKLPDPAVIEWKQWYIVGGVFWRAIPSLAVRRPNYRVLYRDTLVSLITWLFRPLLIPGVVPTLRPRRMEE